MRAQTVCGLLETAYRGRVAADGHEFRPDSDHAAIVGSVARALVSGSGTRGFLFCGLYGNGKTTMMRALQSVLRLVWSADHSVDWRYGIFSAKDLVADIGTGMRGRVLAEYAELPALGIDDLGTEPCERLEYGNVSTPIVDLLEKRYVRRNFTVISSNLNPSEIVGKYGSRVADRLAETLNIIIFSHGSYRSQ